MRRLILDTLMSLDGFFSGPKGEIDWFEFEDEDHDWSQQILERVDTLLFGRITYEKFSQYWPKADPRDGWDPFIIKQLNELQKVVFSSTLKSAAWKPVTLARGSPSAAIAEMKQMPGKDLVILGSGSLVSEVVREGLVDEYRLRLEPIVLGVGKPLFRDQRERRKLKLVNSTRWKSGVVALHYEARR
jgi:dihydrofolate reductase